MSDFLLDISEKLQEKKHIWQFIPISLKNEIGNDKKKVYKGRNIKVAYLVDILHNLIMKYHYNKKNKFNLSAEILREKYGAYYNFYINYLLEHGYIKLISDYCVGLKAKTYSMDTEKCLDLSRYKNVDGILLKKYKRSVLSLELEKTNFNWIGTEIRKKLINDLYYVDIDHEKAFDIVNNIKDKLSHQKNKYAVECVKDKHIFYSFDNYGRCHTNFTVIKSNIRKNCLTIDGMEVDELDINNSQPLFLSLIIQREMENIYVDQNEYEFFHDLVVNGRFYEYYMTINSEVKNKKDAKKNVYKVLFGKNFDDKANEYFKNVFPSIYNFILMYKESQGDYKSLAYELQRSESNLLFNSIIKRIMEEYPEIRLFTVHDSISYPKKYKKEISKIFYDEIDNLFL